MLGIFAVLFFVLIVVLPIAAITVALRSKDEAVRLKQRLKSAEIAIDTLKLELGHNLRQLDSATDESAGPEQGPQVAPQTKTPAPDQEEKSEDIGMAQASVPITQNASDDGTGSASQTDQPANEKSWSGATLEEQLGTKWAVYVGGLALAIGAILLVRYTIEVGLVGPAMRIALGTLLSAGLLGAGEWGRRTDGGLGVQHKYAAHIPSVLTAAGTIGAFATAYSAYALYQFIGPGAAFVIMGVIGVGALMSSALHGPALAALGLVGSHATPALVTSQSPSPWPLVLFLINLSGVAFVLARLRRWPWLIYATVAGVCVWGVLLALQSSTTGNAPWSDAAFVHVLVQSGLVAALLVFVPYYFDWDDAVQRADTDVVTLTTFGALTALFAVTQRLVPFDFSHWLTFSLIMIVGLLATGYLAKRVAGTTVLAGTVVLTSLYLWSDVLQGANAATVLGLLNRVPTDVQAYLQFAVVVSLGLVAVTGYRLYSTSQLTKLQALSYTLAMTVPAVVAYAIAYLRVTDFDYSLRFGVVGMCLAALFACIAGIFDEHRSDKAKAHFNLVTTAAALATVAAVSLALTTVLGRGYLTVAFAVCAFASVVIGLRRSLPALRYVIVPLGLIVLARLIWDPAIAPHSAGQWPILNWLLIGYGVPAACFAGAAWLLNNNAFKDGTTRFCEALALIFATLLVVFQIRHFIHDGDILTGSSSHIEMGLFVITSLGFSFALSQLLKSGDNVVFDYARIVFIVATGLSAFFGLTIMHNPYLSGETVYGPVILSSLVVGYLLPGAFAAVIGKKIEHAAATRDFAPYAIWLGLALIFAYVSLEVRHVFHGENISYRLRTTDVEMWAYNISWLAFAILLLGYGLVRHSLTARIASAGLLTATVLKIGLFDLADLTGFWRALSFICLGAVLIGIGLVYQKLIFGNDRKTLGT